MEAARRGEDMSAVPAFEIGVWNAWLLTLPLFLAPAIVAPFKKGLFAKTSSTATLSRLERGVFVLSKVVLFAIFLYSIVLPLRLGTVWLYVGLPISLVGIVLYIMVSVNIVTTPVDRPVTQGLYRYSRHPIYVTGIFMLLGVSIISASWVFLLFTIIFGVGVTRPYFIKIEEGKCLGHYGDTYKKYIAITPRWIGIPSRCKRKLRHQC